MPVTCRRGWPCCFGEKAWWVLETWSPWPLHPRPTLRRERAAVSARHAGWRTSLAVTDQVTLVCRMKWWLGAARNRKSSAKQIDQQSLHWTPALSACTWAARRSMFDPAAAVVAGAGHRRCLQLMSGETGHLTRSSSSLGGVRTGARAPSSSRNGSHCGTPWMSPRSLYSGNVCASTVSVYCCWECRA